jgi:hypothetical protein
MEQEPLAPALDRGTRSRWPLPSSLTQSHWAGHHHSGGARAHRRLLSRHAVLQETGVALTIEHTKLVGAGRWWCSLTTESEVQRKGSETPVAPCTSTGRSNRATLFLIAAQRRRGSRETPAIHTGDAFALLSNDKNVTNFAREKGRQACVLFRRSVKG